MAARAFAAEEAGPASPAPSKPRRTRNKRDADAAYATDTEAEGETDAEGLSDAEGPPVKPRRTRKKRDAATATDAEGEADAEGLSDLEDEPPAKPRRTRKKREAVNAATDTEAEGETDAEGLSDAEGPPVKPRRTRKKRDAGAVGATDTEGETDAEGFSDSEGPPAKPRKTRARRGATMQEPDQAAYATDTEAEGETDAEGLEDAPPAKPRRTRKKREAAYAATDTEAEGETDAEGLSDAEEGPAVKPRRTRKKRDAAAAASAATDTETDDEGLSDSKQAAAPRLGRRKRSADAAASDTETEGDSAHDIFAAQSRGVLDPQELVAEVSDQPSEAESAAGADDGSWEYETAPPWEVDEHGDLVPVQPNDRTDVFMLEGGPSAYPDEAQAEREVRPRHRGWQQTGVQQALVDEKPGFVSFSFGSEMQFLISELPDGRLNLREVFLTGGDDPERIRPLVRGSIAEEPGFYHLTPVEAHIGGDQMKEVPAEWALEHVIVTKVLHQEPLELDFSEVYCFDCARQMFYRVTTFDAHEEIENPVLRFKPKERVFFIDDADSMPSADQVYDEWEARELGLEVALDPELEEAIAEMSLMNMEMFGESGTLSEVAMAGGWQGPGEEEEEEPEFDDAMDDMMNEDPDVPAVDLA